MFDLPTETVLLLALAALVAGGIDSIAGGGGLITVPALLLAGLGPVEALGTNKLQALFGSGTATFSYAAKGHVDLRRQAPWAVLAFAGSVAGALLATVVPTDILSALLPVLLIAVALYFAFKPRLSDVDRAQRLSPVLFGLTIVPAIGFYDGLFGPGTGSFLMIAFVALAGFGVLKATAHTKVFNFASNVGGFVAFAAVGAVVWPVGLLMGAMQLIGARIGAMVAMRIGASLIKPLLVVVCVALAVRLLADPGNPVRALLGL
ncbi:MAG: TSUP family transporter [Bauldia sp.]|nr:TSUP family transporter [Bauldia sp.]